MLWLWFKIRFIEQITFVADLFFVVRVGALCIVAYDLVTL